MSHNRSSEKTGFVECIRNGDLEGVQNFLRLRTGNLDKSNPRLKEWLKERLNDHKETALHIAVKYQQESIVKWLLQCEADICATDLYLRTVLHTACNENEGTNIIALILKCEGVDVNARDENGITPIWLAAEKGNSNAVKLLMDKGADVTIADKVDNTSLHVAAKTGDLDVLELLLEKLANTRIISKQNKDKETPLHLALTSKNPQCVALLLNAGADSTISVKNEQGQNATDLAREYGIKRIISLLEDPQKAKEKTSLNLRWKMNKQEVGVEVHQLQDYHFKSQLAERNGAMFFKLQFLVQHLPHLVKDLTWEQQYEFSKSLNPQKESGNDWRIVAARLQFSSIIPRLEQRSNPTMELLRECTVTTCKELLEILVDIKRSDVLDDIAKFINNGSTSYAGLLGAKLSTEESLHGHGSSTCSLSWPLQDSENYSSMADSSMSKLKLGPQESEEKYVPSLGDEIQDVESSGLVTSEGGSVSANGVQLTCPAGAVDDPVNIKLKLQKPQKYYGLILNRGLENDLIFVAPIINCQPNGQTFKKHVTLTTPLDRYEKETSTKALLVLHGTPATDGRIFWEDVTRDSKFDLEKEELNVEVTQFSCIVVFLRLTWVHTKEIVTRLNLISFKYTLLVLFKTNRHSPFEDLALVFMSQDIYQEQFYRDSNDSALVQLKRDGFEVLPSNVEQEIGYIYNNESLTVSFQLGEDYKPANGKQQSITFTVDSSVWWSTGHVLKLPLQASGAAATILCGRIVVRGQYGHIREDHFCQQDFCVYVRRLLEVENVIFNLKPVTLKLGLSEETLNEVVACWQSEAKQLEVILQCWRKKQENTDDYAVLRKTLEGLEPEDYRVKERGQMHIEHLRELAVKIVGLQHKDTNMMKSLGQEIKKLWNSILRDCCIEMANSKEDLDLATSTENCAGLLEVHRQIPEDVAKKYKNMCLSPEESIAANFLMIVPHIVQSIKEIFRDEKFPQVQSGLRGVPDETTLKKIVSDIQEAAKDKSIFRLLSEVCNILENLCLNNNDNRSTEDEIHEWGGSAMVIVMLGFLEKFFQSSDARRLHKRLRVFSVAIRDILSNPTAFEGSFLRDFHNVALSLLKFAKFDPSQLVRFELNDPHNSSNTRGKDGLKYDKSTEIFSQLFWIRKESDDELQLEAIACVHIEGCIRTIGAFESLITLPSSRCEAIDRVPIGSLSIAVRRVHDDSGNLRVTLYATQKEKISRALKYLENELGADVVNLSQTEITPSHLKLRSFAKAGTLVKLRLVHKWGSEALVLDSNDFMTLADSTTGGASVPDPEIPEVNQLALGSELPALPAASDSAVANYSGNLVMDPSNAELIQRHLHEQRGRIEIHYHQTFQRGHVCVAGENTSLNMQLPSTEQRFLETGPSAASHKCLTAGTGVHEV